MLVWFILSTYDFSIRKYGPFLTNTHRRACICAHTKFGRAIVTYCDPPKKSDVSPWHPRRLTITSIVHIPTHVAQGVQHPVHRDERGGRGAEGKQRQRLSPCVQNFAVHYCTVSTTSEILYPTVI